MLKQIKKSLTIVTAIAVIMWSFGLHLFTFTVPIARAASATAQFYGSGANNTEPFFFIPPNGQVLPASSSYVGLFSFHLKKTGGESTTLTNVKINLIDGGGASGTVGNTDIRSIAVFKRTSFDYDGGMYTFSAADKIGEIDNSADGSGGLINFTNGASALTIIIDNDKNALPTDFWGTEYYVGVRTSSTWSGTDPQNDQIRYTVSANWITVSDGTLGTACPASGTACQPQFDLYYANAPDGWTGDQFAVQGVEYMGTDGSGNHEVEVQFSSDVDQISAEIVGNYNISGTNPTSATKISPMTVRLIFASAVSITSNQTSLTIAGGGAQSLMGSTLTADAVMVIMGGGGDGFASPLLISEVMIGTATSGQEEFIELYNPTPSEIDLSLMPIKVWVGIASGTSITHTKIASLSSGTIASNEYYLIAPVEYTGITPAADATYNITNLNLGTEGALQENAGVYISTSDSQNVAIMDLLGWGTAPGELAYGPPKCSSTDPESCTVANDGKSLERKANNSSTASTMASGGIDAANGNSYMSHSNQYDFVQQATANPQKTSTTEAPGGAGFGDSNAPAYINHEPVYSAVASQDLIAIAEFMDDSGAISASNAKLYYRFYDADGNSGNGVVAGSWNSVTGSQTSTGSSYYRFTVPNASLDANKDLDYFLRAYDGTAYTCLPSPCALGADPVLDANTTPFYVNVVATGGNGIISGTVANSSGNGIANVLVFTAGLPFTATTNTSGAFTLSGLPDGLYDLTVRGGSYSVSGSTDNYLDGGLYGIYINSNNQTSSGNTITLIQGVIESQGGTAADQENPWVMWSVPGDMAMGHPKAEDLVVVFDRAMQAGTVTGGADDTDNIYLIDNSGTVIPGTVTYCDDSSGSDACYVNGTATGSGRPSDKPPVTSDPDLMYYNPDLDLTTGTSYTLVIKDTVIGKNGQRLMGNRPSGGHSIGFTVAQDFIGSSGTYGDDYNNYTFGKGASFPPYVIGTTPGSGAFDVAINAKINITFSEPMSTVSINTTNIKMYTVSNPYSSSETETAYNAYAVTLNTAGETVIITPTGNLTASTNYRVKVMSNTTSADGTPMSNSNNTEMFRIEFGTGTSADSTAPAVAGTYPNNSDTNIPNNLPSVSIGFNEAMDASTINARTIKLKRGTTAVSGTVEYNVGDRTAYFMPTNALRPGAIYTIAIISGATGVTDIAGNTMTADAIYSFTTDSTADATAPFVEFARCDDYSCSITFSEPMVSARADDASNYANSVLKAANYAITGGANLSAVRTEYDQMNNTVILDNISGLTSGNSFTLTATNVKDKAGNPIDTGNNSFTGTVENSMGTGGMMGPGGPGPMMGPATMMDASGNNFGGAGFVAPETGDQGMGMLAGMGGSMGFDFGGRWEKPTNVMPMNTMAAKTTKYIVEFEAGTAIPAGGKIKITFPVGTDVSQAQRVPDAQSMPNKDINGPASGTVKIAGTEATQSGGLDDDGVSVSAVSRTVTITVDASNSGISANDLIMLELKGIKNPGVPKSYDSNGYTADIKTFSPSNALLESLTSFPYFINEAGDYTLSGTVTATGATTGTATIYLDSWITGPMETDVNFATNANGTAAYSFTGLSEGDYRIFTEPSISLGGSDYVGYTNFESIFVNSGTCTSNTCTKNFSFTKQDSSSAYELTVQIVGDFSGMSGTDLDIDIFAGGQNGNTIKTVTLLAQNYTVGSPYSANIYLTNAGEWWVGMGPAIPHGTMIMGPPPMPSWIPPQDVRVSVSGALGSPSWVEQSSVEDNDGIIRFSVTGATNQIIGYVVDSSGTAIANVDVSAHRTQGGFGMPSNAQTDTNGKFTLKVSTGVYEVNAWSPGMPGSPGRVVDVRTDTDSGATDGNSTADVYKDNGTVLVVDLIDGYSSSALEEELLLKLDKSSTTISGKLLDDVNNPVANAPVWAYNQTTGENMPSGTDSSGNYTIYVGNGDWYVEAFIPGIGDLSYASNPVTVSGSNRSDINIRPSVTNLAIITGIVTVSGSAVTNANVWIQGTDPSGAYYSNGTNTNSSGEYRLRVPGGTGYSLYASTPDYGELDPITLGAITAGTTYTGGTDYTDFTIASSAMNVLTINFTNNTNVESGTEAFVNIFDPSAGKGNHQRIDDLSVTSSTTINIKSGSSYELHLNIPGLGDISATCANGANIVCTDNASSPDTWAITGDASVTFALPDTSSLYTFTVTVTSNASGTPTIADAFVWLSNDTSGFHAGEPTNSSGVATITVPDGTYKLGVDKSGFTGPAPAAVVTSTDDDCSSNDCTKALTLATNPYTLSGRIYTDSNSNSSYDSGEEISKAWVWADKVTSATDFSFAGGWTGTEVDPDGTYELSISDGFWLVRAVTDAYSETIYKDSSGERAAIQVNGASLTDKDIAMVARSGYTATEPKLAPVTPASGGTVDDSANTGVKLVIPPSALGTGTSAGTINISDTYSVPATGSIAPLGGKSKEISATNSSGQAVTNLSGSVNIEISFNESDLPTGIAESELFLAYFDDSSNQWVQIPAAVDTTNNTISGNTTHLSQYIVGYSADTGAPTQPGTPSSTSTTATTIALTWTASTDSETSVDGYQILRSRDGSTFTTIGSTDPWSTGSYVSGSLNSTNTYSDSGLTANTTYYYQVVAFDTAGNHSTASANFEVTTTLSQGGMIIPSSSGSSNRSSRSTTTTTDTTDASSDTTTADTTTETTTTETTVTEETPSRPVNARALQISRIVSEARSVAKAVVGDVIALVSKARNISKEQEWATTINRKVIQSLTPSQEVRNAITNFVTYGTPESLSLGAGERAGVVNSFKEALGKLPETEADWEDVLKISVGRWPTQRSTEKETTAEATFKTIYLRAPDRANPNDDAAVVVMSYGLRPLDRNLDSERAAIKSFRAIFSKDPVTATEWDTVRAISYSGATR